MEEVDAIILQSLREIGCNIDSDAKLLSLSPEEIFKCLGKLCKCIKPDAEIATHLPANNMAQKFAAASQMVDLCKTLGFKGDLGYQTILYSNPVELRRLFMWLIEKMPKSEEPISHTSDLSQAKTIENDIFHQLAIDLKRSWILEFLQPQRNFSANPVDLEKPAFSKNLSDDNRLYEPTIFHQTRHLLSSIIATLDKELTNSQTLNYQDVSAIAQKLRSSSAIRSSQSLNVSSSPSTSFVTVQTISEAEGLSHENKPQSRCGSLAENIEELENKIVAHDNIYRQLTIDKKQQLQLIHEETLNLELLKETKKLKERVTMLLDDHEVSKQKLIQSLESAKSRKETLNSKFEAHKTPLIAQLESLSGTNSVKLQQAAEKTNAIKNLTKMITEIQEDIKLKSKTQQQLQTELSQMKRVTERSAYTTRIADIIKSIKRQNNDINEILKDTKSIQKAINSIEGQLQRQFTVTEDLVWNNTNKKDEFSKKAYKLLITLHTEFSELVNLIETTGSVQREIRDLEDQIDNERQQNVQKKFEQITKDLELISQTV